MSLYLLQSLDDRFPGCNIGMIVRAGNSVEARKTAANNASDEGEWVWTDPDRSTCDIVHPDGDREIILCDFIYVESKK